VPSASEQTKVIILFICQNFKPVTRVNELGSIWCGINL
jgi:hypothetical protein